MRAVDRTMRAYVGEAVLMVKAVQELVDEAELVSPVDDNGDSLLLPSQKALKKVRRCLEAALEEFGA